MEKIAILSGWPWLEQDIARKSAETFKKYLKKDFDYYDFPQDRENFLNNKEKYSLVIPVFHGEYGEDGRIFAFLDILEIPHIGSNYYTHALWLNKKEANILAKNAWLRVPEEYIAKSSKDFPKTYPVMMKPNKGGSSFHTYKILNDTDFEEKFLATQADINDDILVQEYIVGDEYSISIVNGEILPIMKLEKQNQEDFFDYESKYENENSIKEIFPEIEEKLFLELTAAAKTAENIFQLKWFFRVDMLVRDNTPYFLEINTIPGMTDTSILPKAWKLTRRSMEELIETIVR